jgi:hypothetical protein
MKVYQDLVFRGGRDQLDHLISSIEERLSDGWVRSRKREKEVGLISFGLKYCFSCIAKGPRASSDLWLSAESETTLYVSSIVPRDYSSLTYDQYNEILREFHDRFARPAADSVGVRVDLGNSEFHIDDVLSPSAAQALRSFSGLANRSVVHPLDRERWVRFLTIAYREHAPLSSGMLERWLVEEEKWPEDKVSDLIVEYERSRDLLKAYEAQQA